VENKAASMTLFASLVSMNLVFPGRARVGGRLMGKIRQLISLSIFALPVSISLVPKITTFCFSLAGWNEGFNIAEATNLATEEWFTYMEEKKMRPKCRCKDYHLQGNGDPRVQESAIMRPIRAGKVKEKKVEDIDKKVDVLISTADRNLQTLTTTIDKVHAIMVQNQKVTDERLDQVESGAAAMTRRADASDVKNLQQMEEITRRVHRLEEQERSNFQPRVASNAEPIQHQVVVDLAELDFVHQPFQQVVQLEVPQQQQPVQLLRDGDAQRNAFVEVQGDDEEQGRQHDDGQQQDIWAGVALPIDLPPLNDIDFPPLPYDPLPAPEDVDLEHVQQVEDVELEDVQEDEEVEYVVTVEVVPTQVPQVQEAQEARSLLRWPPQDRALPPQLLQDPAADADVVNLEGQPLAQQQPEQHVQVVVAHVPRILLQQQPRDRDVQPEPASLPQSLLRLPRDRPVQPELLEDDDIILLEGPQPKAAAAPKRGKKRCLNEDNAGAEEDEAEAKQVRKKVREDTREKLPGGSVMCLICRKIYKNLSSFAKHAERYRNDKNHVFREIKFDCKYCDKQCPSKKSLAMHITRKHGQNNGCCPGSSDCKFQSGSTHEVWYHCLRTHAWCTKCRAIVISLKPYLVPHHGLTQKNKDVKRHIEIAHSN
jgi:hypothetical protein